MQVAVSTPGYSGPDVLLELQSFLLGEQELRGAVRLAEREPGAGELGVVADVLLIALAPSGVVAAFAPAVVAWLRSRHTDVRIMIRRPDGTQVEFTAVHVRRMSGDELPALADSLTQWVTGEDTGHPGLPDGKGGE